MKMHGFLKYIENHIKSECVKLLTLANLNFSSTFSFGSLSDLALFTEVNKAG